MGKKGDLSDFEPGMVDGPGRAGMSKSQTADFNAQPFLGFTENIQ